MGSSETIPAEIAGRWHDPVILKRDLFSTVERGRFDTPEGAVDAVLRRIDLVPWWTWPLAHRMCARERRTLIMAGSLGVAPRILFANHRLLVRSYIEGTMLDTARPFGDRAYFRSAKAVLRKLHRAGISHNDLAKEQNWLRGPDGQAYVTDFQLSVPFSRRGRLFRVLAYEDMRHLLKHKRRYVPDALTPTERRILARKSALARAWMVTAKPLYYWITRDLLRFVDREGGGPRLAYDAPAIEKRLKAHPQVREAVVVGFPDRRGRTGLYAFVEATVVAEAALRDFIAGRLGAGKIPDHIQVVDRLPRDAAGLIHREVLQLVALNQVDLVKTLAASEADRIAAAGIVAERRNLRDRLAI